MTSTARSIQSRSRTCPQCGNRRDVRGELCQDCQRAGVPDVDGTLDNVSDLATSYRAAMEYAQGIREELDAAISAAKRDGYSYARLRDASGLAVATIQNIVGRDA